MSAYMVEYLTDLCWRQGDPEAFELEFQRCISNGDLTPDEVSELRMKCLEPVPTPILPDDQWYRLCVDYLGGLGSTSEQVAALLGVSPHAIARIRRGERPDGALRGQLDRLVAEKAEAAVRRRA